MIKAKNRIKTKISKLTIEVPFATNVKNITPIVKTVPIINKMSVTDKTEKIYKDFFSSCLIE